MGLKHIPVFALLIVLTFAINEDMIETGYLQDPATVGQLPSGFNDDLIEMEDTLDNEQLIEKETNKIEDERDLEDDIMSMDRSMQLEIKNFCKDLEEQGKDDVLCRTHRF